MSVLLRRYYQLLKYVINSKWLLQSTTIAIFDAFGNDGDEVIKATNAYLKGIAATDPKKASALAGFINEDPMLVCSLGLEVQLSIGGMPIRWLVNNNSGKMYTGITPQSNTGVRLLVRNTQNVRNGSVFSAGVKDDRYAMYEQGRNLIYWYYPSSYASTDVGFETPRKVEYNINGKLTVKGLQGTQLFQKNLSQRNCSDELMIGWKYISSPNGYNDYGLFEVVNGNGETIGKFTAYDDNGTIKCIDIHNVRLVNMEGTFGMSYTLQDGVTPWTPLNQTP